MLTGYRENGYAILPRLFSRANCLALIAAGRALGGDGRPHMNPHRDVPLIRDAMSRTELVELIDELVGGEAMGLQSVLYVSPPGCAGFTPHQDNAFVQAPPGAFVSAWVSLVDTNFDNGGLHGFIGSHRYGLLPTLPAEGHPPTPYDDPNSRSTHTLLPAGWSGFQIDLSAGDVLLMHGDFVHASSRNTSQHPRWALLMTYLRRGAEFRAGNTARREPIELRAA